MTTSRTRPPAYDHAAAEAKWQARWAESGLYRVTDDDPRPKWFELTMYPYPSGDLHIGHWYAMSPADAHARFQRMLGYNVMHPMGFDAFGLPAENAAIKRGIHPYEWTMANMANMRRQLRSMGTVYDWDREVVTCDPEYYRWNQWFFLKFLENDLAYQSYAPANWCPTDNTVLANEQVLDGKCERCGTEVIQRDLNQWFFRITKYAEELLDTSKIDWPHKINVMQTNWIGRSTGVEIGFDISHLGLSESEIKTFTTRIDTIFGVTFVVIAPEHPLVEEITTPGQRAEVEAYVESARKQSEIERLAADKPKTGVPTGATCVNPLTGERVPILVGDYVLLSYGTGIVMGVPAHDERDFVFAKTYGLRVRVVVAPPDWDGSDLDAAYTEPGTQVNSGEFDGLESEDGKDKIAEHIEANGWGARTVNYRMRDWLISRQRYWGTPIPIIYCDECGTVPVPEGDLPVLLPDDAEFLPTGESPLTLHEGFLNVDCPRCAGPATRETDTMDTFVDSSWYYLRYASPHYTDGPFDPAAIKQWEPVNQYTGGAEHAVMHLLYSRFFVRALRDLGMLDFDEPFTRLFNQGHITHSGSRMSKSRGNVVSPDDYVGQVGADAVRCYLMFLGPWDQGGDWNDGGIPGMGRWLGRVWNLCTRDAADLDVSPVSEDSIRDLDRAVHKTIKKITEDLGAFKFNTSLAALMELTNAMTAAWDKGDISADAWRSATDRLTLMLAPMAPHITEEMWERAGDEYSVHSQDWPKWDPELAADEVITLVVQVNGKVRDRIETPADIAEESAKQLALVSEKVAPHTAGKNVVKVIYVPGRLVNIVAR
jgi:leucyl-tRNA synthetase